MAAGVRAHLELRRPLPLLDDRLLRHFEFSSALTEGHAHEPEQLIFPEITHDKVAKVRGMDVTIVTSARTDEEGRELLKLMNMPFRLK